MIDLLEMPGRCRGCNSTAYTRRELNAHPGQDWRCYRCFDLARGFTPVFPVGRHGCDRVVNGRVKLPQEGSIGRIQVGWHGSRPLYADIYPSDLYGTKQRETRTVDGELLRRG